MSAALDMHTPASPELQQELGKTEGVPGPPPPQGTGLALVQTPTGTTLIQGETGRVAPVRSATLPPSKLRAEVAAAGKKPPPSAEGEPSDGEIPEFLRSKGSNDPAAKDAGASKLAAPSTDGTSPEKPQGPLDLTQPLTADEQRFKEPSLAQRLDQKMNLLAKGLSTWANSVLGRKPGESAPPVEPSPQGELGLGLAPPTATSATRRKKTASRMLRDDSWWTGKRIALSLLIILLVLSIGYVVAFWWPSGRLPSFWPTTYQSSGGVVYRTELDSLNREMSRLGQQVRVSLERQVEDGRRIRSLEEGQEQLLGDHATTKQRVRRLEEALPTPAEVKAKLAETNRTLDDNERFIKEHLSGKR